MAPISLPSAVAFRVWSRQLWPDLRGVLGREGDRIVRDRRVLGRLLFGVVVLAATGASAQTLTRGPFIQNPDALTTTMTIEWWTDVAGNSTVDYGLTPALGS